MAPVIDFLVYTAILTAFGLSGIILTLMIRNPLRRHFFQNLTRASRILKPPSGVLERGDWRNGYYRDHSGSARVNCVIKYVCGGILVRDIYSHISFLPLKYGTVFIPWTKLVNERVVSLGWYVSLFNKREWIELDVVGHEFSIIVPNGED